jgi:hypothetical protein
MRQAVFGDQESGQEQKSSDDPPTIWDNWRGFIADLLAGKKSTPFSDFSSPSIGAEALMPIPGGRYFQKNPLVEGPECPACSSRRLSFGVRL